MKSLAQYKNGNYVVTIYDDGTKERRSLESNWGEPEFPESIDLKITNFCDQACPFCHEMSTKQGTHCDIEFLEVLKTLPVGVEIAIGGGNPLSHPDFLKILVKLKSYGLICNLTVHSSHLTQENELIRNLQDQELLYGIGVSCKDYAGDYGLKNEVVHLIAGISDPQLALHYSDSRILILGYKKFGFGDNWHSDDVENNLKEWRYWMPAILCGKLVSFDNLALEQLNIKQLIPKNTWEKHYMGDDGEFTMYIDAVKKEYAISSTSKRTKCDNKTIQEMFHDVRYQ